MEDLRDTIFRNTKSDHKRVKRANTITKQPTKTIELMVAADYKMVEHYSKLFLPTYILATSNIVSLQCYN